MCLMASAIMPKWYKKKQLLTMTISITVYIKTKIEKKLIRICDLS